MLKRFVISILPFIDHKKVFELIATMKLTWVTGKKKQNYITNMVGDTLANE